MFGRRIWIGLLIAVTLLSTAGMGPGVAARSLAQETEGATIPYAGRLTGDGGQVVAEGAYDLQFVLYAAQTGGEPLWTETQVGVAVRGGAFGVALGSGTPIPKALLESGALWLAVSVRGPGESAFTPLEPRQRLSAVAPSAPDSVGCPHDHFGEWWAGSSASAGLVVDNSAGTGDGIRGYANATAANYAGVYGVNYSSGSGVYGHSSGGKGVFGSSSAAGGEGVHGEGTGEFTEGVLGTATGIHGTGVYGIASAGSGDPVGVWGQTGLTWGLYTDQQVYAGSGCVNCLIAFVGRNADAAALEVGDVVAISGVAPPLMGQRMPLLEVQRATTSEGALGIVQARAEVATRDKLVLTDGTEQTEAIEMANMTQGPVAPGDYLFIVIQGLIQVRADPGSSIQAGDRLTAGNGGLALRATPDTQTIGRAVDAVDPATGLVWVLVDLQ
jgi:hypothetical protein